MNAQDVLSSLDKSISSTQGIYIDSLHFLLFALLAIVVCRLIPSQRFRLLLLAAFNLYFVGLCLNSLSQVLLLVSIVVGTYAIGMAKLAKGDGWTGAMQAAVLIFLWIFLFLVKDPNLLAPLNPFSWHPIALIGVSFLLFRCISYVSDIDYIGDKSFLNLVNYLLFFPSLLSGPIEKFDEFSEQFNKPADDDPSIVLPAMHRIANGLIKKYVLADNLMTFGVFSIHDPLATSSLLVWLGVLLQWFIIFLDFSGYCDIMIGVARLMGFRLSENFDRPFSSSNIQEFWTRWHITLGRFVRDYLFLPLQATIYRNVKEKWQFPTVLAVYFFVMMVILLWHGTTWGFFVMGCLHGTALVALLLFRKYKLVPVLAPYLGQHGEAIAWALLTYLFVSLTVVFWHPNAQWGAAAIGRMMGWK